MVVFHTGKPIYTGAPSEARCGVRHLLHLRFLMNHDPYRRHLTASCQHLILLLRYQVLHERMTKKPHVSLTLIMIMTLHLATLNPIPGRGVPDKAASWIQG